MAITVVSQPTAVHTTVWHNFALTVSSDRDDSTAFTCSAVADNGGKVRLTLSALPKEGDVLLLSGFTNIPNTYYNVLSIGAGVATIDLDWSTLFVGNSGTATKANRNFKIKCEIYNEAVKIAETYIFSNTGIYTIVPNEILKTIVAPQHIAYNATAIARDDWNAKRFQIIFTEVYNDADNLVITKDFELSLIHIIQNIKRQHFQTKTLAEFATEGNSMRMLSDIPFNNSSFLINPIELYDEEYFIASFLWSTTAGNKTLVRRYYDASGTVIGAATDLVTTVTSDTRRAYVRVLNDATLRAITPAVVYAACYVGTISPAARFSEIVRFKIIRENREACTTRIYFINRYGSLDAFTFTGFSETSDSIQRSMYEKRLAINYGFQDAGDSIYHIEGERSFSCYSHWLGDAEAIWLAQLLAAPMAWVQKNNQALPIIIKNTSQMIESREGIQLKLDYKYANKLI
jgi:hypothetical protein